MKKDLLVLLFLGLVICLVYFKAFSVFFAQDDFILINQFSQSGILTDFVNVFGYPTVTHWRPLHNLYFFISGNLFGKNYFGYHLFTFALHIANGFLIYKISLKFFKRFNVAILSALLYGVNPLHFISIFWISGGATTIGFLFFAIAFYFYLNQRRLLTICFFLFSLLASEGMIVTLGIFYYWEVLVGKYKISLSFLAKISFSALVFLAVRYLFFTPKIAFDVYKFELSPNTFRAVKYYLSRIAGFGETSGDALPSFLFLCFLVSVAFLVFRKIRDKKNLKLFSFFIAAVIIGLFPFILIPTHISAHYMNISAFGFSMIAALALIREREALIGILAFLFFVASLMTVDITQNKSWVTEKSLISKHYISQIEKDNLPNNSLLIFGDNSFSSSEETYISLGTGQALRFWFKDKNYKGCFNFFESCQEAKNSILIN